MEKRAVFLESQPALKAENLLFLDECSISTAINHRYGWAKRGERVTLYAPTHGARRTLLGVIGVDGRQALTVLERGLRIPTFIEFVRNKLVPILRPGDVIVMDNLQIHKNLEAVALIESTGARALFQPPYSPEFNAIEFCWGWLKHGLRRSACRGIQRLIQQAWSRWHEITPTLCRGWARGSGYSVAKAST